MQRIIRLGTRASPLALAQAEETRDRLRAAHDLPPEAVEIVPIKTTGDQVLDRALSEIGGKGLFTKEIEEALFDGRIDIAVHSMKDLPTRLPEGLTLAAVLPREDVRDAFISPTARSLADLPQGAIVGTASLRRQAQVRRRRPDLQVITFRGNVQTRLRKLEEGQAAATFLAMAGLNRLGRPDVATRAMAAEEMLPAVAQGAIGLEIRADDDTTRLAVAPLDDPDTADCVATERGFLDALDGSCRTPIAGLARLDGGDVVFQGEILRPDGSEAHSIATRGPRADGARLGYEAGQLLRSRAGPGFFDHLG
ncbi:hydroxymethylbilane synthase [Futiania mangrovi]|uniref:Porphobilinogen deaminase n=1 Tax=Futiania mangrovi TaxID=2959716 RepID=A0A9J6PJ62_9PROT|nr:hydroxymethylbilane synthase [Futiania mangrovii]MCP1336591.1 hydroxymethylbilane synthase [Futiania mangrovii]